MQELVDFRRDPPKFQKLAVTFPRACDGPATRVPARYCSLGAIGEAKVPLFSVSVPISSNVRRRRRRITFATCSRTPRSMRRASSSSMKLTRSAAIADAGLGGVATMNASRRFRQMLVEMDGLKATPASS